MLSVVCPLKPRNFNQLKVQYNQGSKEKNNYVAEEHAE